MEFDPTDKRMLDIGCGIGGMTRYFSDLFAEAHGVDFSKELIKKALLRNDSNRKKAARELKISERTLYRKIKQFDLE